MRHLMLLTLVLPVLCHAQSNVATSPSAVEMAALYEINRARSNPQAYDTEQGLGGILTGITPAAPLALNERLVTSARFHSVEMATHGYFAHQSAITGTHPNLMVRNAGYPLRSTLSDTSNNIESLACLFTSGSGGVTYAPAAAIRALILDAGVSPPGHRYHLLAWGGDSATINFYRQFREVGTGYGEGFQPEDPYSAATPPNGSGAYWSIHTGYRDVSNPWICGVIYNDLNLNGRYDAGEGIGGVAVSTTGAAVLNTVTGTAGGFSLQAAVAGAYTVTASGGAFSGVATASINVGTDNVWVDFRSGQSAGSVNFNSAPEIDVQRPAGVSIASGTAQNLGNVGTTPQSLTFTVANLGQGTLQLTGTPAVAVTPLSGAPAVSVSQQPATSVAPSATTTFIVNVTPPAGAFSFQISITNNDANESPYLITVSGNNLPPYALSGPAVAGPAGGPFVASINPGAILSGISLALWDPEAGAIVVSSITGSAPSGVVAPSIPVPGHPLVLDWTGTAGAANPPGDYTWQIQFTDQAGAGPVHATLTLTIVNLPPSHSPGIASGDGTAGSPYAWQFLQGEGAANQRDLCNVADPNTGQSLSASGVAAGGNPGSVGFAFAVSGGVLRAAPTGTLSAAEVGLHAYTVTISDGVAQVQVFVELTVLGSSGAIVFTTPQQLPSGKVGEPFTAAISVTGATGAVTFALNSGVMPPGLTLSGGVISGTPSRAATYLIEIRANDSTGDFSLRQFSLLVESEEGSGSGCAAGAGTALPLVALFALLRRRRKTC